MKTIWVVVLSLVALAIGAFSGIAWRGGKTTIAGLRTSCEMIQLAETSGLMTKAQLEDTLSRLQKTLAEKGKGHEDGMDTIVGDIRETCKVLAPAKKS